MSNFAGHADVKKKLDSAQAVMESVLAIERLHRTLDSYDYQGCDMQGQACDWCQFIRPWAAHKMEELRIERMDNSGQKIKRFEDLGYLCGKCARENGGDWPEGHCATWHRGECNQCKAGADLCHWSDWNWPNHPERNTRANLGENFGGREL